MPLNLIVEKRADRRVTAVSAATGNDLLTKWSGEGAAPARSWSIARSFVSPNKKGRASARPFYSLEWDFLAEAGGNPLPGGA
jgi:hypothetical protein